MPFDPSKPFKVVNSGFDPSKPFKVIEESPKKEAGFIDSMSALASQAKNPMDVLTKGYSDAQVLTNKLGEVTAEEMGKQGYDPRIAAGLGTIISMSPDVMTSMGPSSPIKASRLNPDIGIEARHLATRALGFTKRLLKTQSARGQAAKAAQVALEEGVIPAMGSPEVMYERAQDLASKSGKEIGEALKKSSGNLTEVFDGLETLRKDLTMGGLKDGLYESTNNRIDMVQKTIVELVDRGENASGKVLTELKNKLANKLNYFTDLESQVENKAIVRNIANKVRKFVEAASSPEEFKQFLDNQRKFSAAETMKIGLDNELSKAGNKPLSLMSIAPAAAQIGMGRPIEAAATIGLLEGVNRRGAGIGANALNVLNKTGEKIPAGLRSPINLSNVTGSATMGFNRKRKQRLK